MASPPRPGAVRLGRSTRSWLFRVAGLLAVCAAAFVVTMAVQHKPLSLPTLGLVMGMLGLIFGLTSLGLALTNGPTWVDPQAGQILIRGGDWIPLSEVRFGRTGLVRGNRYLTLGEHAKRTFTVSDTAIFGNAGPTLQWVYWVAASSGLPETRPDASGTESKPEVLAWIDEWR